MAIKILPTITTTDKEKIKDKLDEINLLKIKEICVFPTCLEKNERSKFYSDLEKTKITSIPFVHLRSDMEPAEIEYFIKKYHTKVFNIHSPKTRPISNNWNKFLKNIYIENGIEDFDYEEVVMFGGVCIDFSHLENFRLRYPASFKNNIEVINKTKCGCGHISAIKEEYCFREDTQKYHHDSHFSQSLSEFDYLSRYKPYFPPILATELENQITEQLDIIKYINKKII